jgi:hypothetical protein
VKQYQLTGPVARSNSMSKGAAFLIRSRFPVNLYLKLNGWLWRLPSSQPEDARPIRLHATLLQKLVSRRPNHKRFTGTSLFFRKRPAVLGRSIGAKVYSILSTIRRARPGLVIRMCALDNSPDVLNVATEAVYSSQTSCLGRRIDIRADDGSGVSRRV